MAFSTTPSAGADRLRTTADNQTINALGGNDWLFSAFNATKLYGGNGHDRLWATLSARGPSEPNSFHITSLFGGNGNDWLSTKLTAHTAEDGGPDIRSYQSGGRGNDTIFVDATVTTDASWARSTVRIEVDGGAGNDSIWIETGGETIEATNTVRGGAGSDVIHIYGDADPDLGSVENFVDAGTGNDEVTVFSSGGDNTLRGGGGNDRIEAVLVPSGGFGFNELHGDGGNDLLIASARTVEGTSFVWGGAGNDTIRVYGGDANELNGGTGNDNIRGGSGFDQITGGAGADTLRGGDGADRFIYRWMSESTAANSDRILDFAGGEDVISLLSIDADVSQEGKQAFTFGGTGVGRVWVEDSETSGASIIRADNGSGVGLYITVEDGDDRVASDWTAGDFMFAF